MPTLTGDKIIAPHPHQLSRFFSLHCLTWYTKIIYFLLLRPSFTKTLILLNKFLDHLVVSVIKGQRWQNLFNCSRSQTCYLLSIGARLHRIFCFSTNQTKVQILDYRQMAKCIRRPFPLISQTKGKNKDRLIAGYITVTYSWPFIPSPYFWG